MHTDVLPMSVRQMIAKYERALTAEELAGILSVSERSVQERAKRGTIPCFRIGTSVRFCPKTVSDWLSKQ